MAGLQPAPPASWYLSPEAFALERERVRYREWFCAGRAGQVERPGSLEVLDVAGEGVLLGRTGAGALRPTTTSAATAAPRWCRRPGAAGSRAAGRPRRARLHHHLPVHPVPRPRPGARPAPRPRPRADRLGAAHGFKFAPLLGRLLADLALHGGTEVGLDPFDPGRAALTAPTIEPNYLV